MTDLRVVGGRYHSPPGGTGHLPPGDGGGTSGEMERRIASLEENQKQILAMLEKLREGQQAAALTAADQRGTFSTALAEVSGKLSNIALSGEGLRRDVDRLPTKFDVATIIVLVIGGLGGVASIVKTVWPHAFGG